MSIKIMAEVWDHSPCRGGELIFLLTLADQAGDHDRCAWPGMRQLMSRTRSSRRSVYNYAEALQQSGIIERVDPEVAAKRISRYVGGQQNATIVWRILPVEEWESVWEVPDGADDADQGEAWGGAESASLALLGGATFSRVGVQPAALEPKLNNHQQVEVEIPAAQVSQRRRRVREDQAEMDDPTDAVWGPSRKPEDRPKPRRQRGTGRMNGGMDTAPGLAQYFTDQQQAWCQRHADVRIGHNREALRGFFYNAAGLGVTPDVLKQMVDQFFAESRLTNQRGPLWKIFVRNAEPLRHQLVQQPSVENDDVPEVETPQFGGAIPQSVLDEILADRGSG